ncbi:uncharacterized protein LTHEOB_8087 [Lasiodiplodia theobromae]|uniref:uncharacterized protein n=1 Tax=Lasiodiplodia theobromae TaxID=45133 RepID=UPI0015C375C4|nr:uncharacterized protein LTHEOB_8087 [Lasiodiplodia theobromae]KAF4541933.1 hypothetical protein LTHEOB_8087 [Lasiodiplodia theobromae]
MGSFPAPWTEAELQPYKDYPMLYLERKLAKYTTPRMRISFMDVDPDVRIMIWEHFLLLSHPIDILSADTPSPPHQYRSLRPYLAWMRLNRALHAEIASVFYSRNEFRFTKPDPPRAQWLVLHAFLNTIGPRHCRFLRRLHVDAPLRCDGERFWDPLLLGKLKDGVRAAAPGLLPALLGTAAMKRQMAVTPAERSGWRTVEGHVDGSGWRPDHVAREATFRSVCRLLEAAAGALCKLELVVKIEWQPYGESYYTPVVVDDDGEENDNGAVCSGAECSEEELADQEHCRRHRNAYVWACLERLRAALPQLEVAVVLHHGDWARRRWRRKRAKLHLPVLREARERGYIIGHSSVEMDEGMCEPVGDYVVTYDEYVMQDSAPQRPL